MNLILDAMKTIKGRGRTLTLRTSREGEDYVRVEVVDNGTGFSVEDAERIFEPFFTSKSGGMGMGLPICRTIVEDHGGKLQAAPNKKYGACFGFTLVAVAGS